VPFQQLQSYESQLQIHVSTLQAFHLIKNIAGIHNNSTHVTKNNKYTCYSTISECFSGVACVVKGLVFTCMTSTTTRTIYRTASSDIKTGLSRELSYTEVHTVTDESKGQYTLVTKSNLTRSTLLKVDKVDPVVLAPYTLATKSKGRSTIRRQNYPLLTKSTKLNINFGAVSTVTKQ